MYIGGSQAEGVTARAIKNQFVGHRSCKSLHQVCRVARSRRYIRIGGCEAYETAELMLGYFFVNEVCTSLNHLRAP